jgi:hypothetical protein
MGGPDDREPKQSGRWCSRGVRRCAAPKSEKAQKTELLPQTTQMPAEGRTFRLVYLVVQKTGVSFHTPHTALNASHISPIVT